MLATVGRGFSAEHVKVDLTLRRRCVGCVGGGSAAWSGVIPRGKRPESDCDAGTDPARPQATRVRLPPDPFRHVAGCVVPFWSGETMEKRLPTVIVLFLFVLAVSVAECVVCLLKGDL